MYPLATVTNHLSSYIVLHFTDSSSVRATPPKRHGTADLEPPTPAAPSGGSPSHSRSLSGSSEGHSSRKSSRDSERMVVSPSHRHRHHHSAHQTSSSVSSSDRSSASPINISAYEQMLLNGSSRRSPSHPPQPRKSVGRSLSPPDRGGSPSGASTRQVVPAGSPPPPTEPQQQQQKRERGRMASPPTTEATSPPKYVRKPHRYDMVKLPHSYEEVEFVGQGLKLQLSQMSAKSEAKLNSVKPSRSSKKGGSEKGRNQLSNVHLSDTRLNRMSKRRGSDKGPRTQQKSPSASKRFSTGAVFATGSGAEARRRQENSQAFIKAKYRVSSPISDAETMTQQYPRAAESAACEESHAQDMFLTSGDFGQVRKEMIIPSLLYCTCIVRVITSG